MLTNTQLDTMLSLQNEMNSTVNPDWLAAGYPFLRAVVVEGAEAIEHHGWKWWKKQEMDLPQVQLELVDIFHFVLSHFIIQEKGELAKARDHILALSQQADSFQLDGDKYEIGSLTLLEKLEMTVALAALKRVSIGLFAAMLEDCEMDWQELFKQYVGKNTLNLFRQEKGYKEGTYIKEWHGREDNEVLVDLMNKLDPTKDDFKDQLMSGLRENYPG